MEKLEIRVVIKYFCKKGMPPMKIHKDFMETLGKESPSYSTVNKWQQSLRGPERALRMIDGLTTPKMPPMVKMSRLCTPWLCVIGGGDLRSIASEVGMHFGAVQSILTTILGMSKGSARWALRMLSDDQKRTWLDISRYLLSCYEDDPGDFIELVVTQDGFPILTHSQKWRANNESTLAHPFLRHLRGFIQQGR